MLLLVTLLTQRHQVRVVQRDRRVAQVVRRDRLPVMHMSRWFDQTAAQTDLAESVPLL